MFPAGSDIAVLFVSISPLGANSCGQQAFILRHATLQEFQSFDKYLDHVLGTEAGSGNSCIHKLGE